MAVSGTFTLDGTTTGGAKVTVLDTGADPTVAIGATTTASDGTWSVDVGSTTTVECLLDYDDGTDQYKTRSKPYIAHEAAASETIVDDVSFGYHDNWLAFGNHLGEAVIHEHDAANSWPEYEVNTEPVSRCYSVTFSQDEQWFAAAEYGSPYEVHIYDAPAVLTPVSGTFTYNGTGTSGATVRGINDTQGTHQGTDTTDTNGDFSIEFPVGDEGHFMIEYTDPDTGEPAKAESKPFIVPQ